MDKAGRSFGELPNEMVGHTSWACGHLENKHGDRHHMPEAAYGIRWILSIIGLATLILTA